MLGKRGSARERELGKKRAPRTSRVLLRLLKSLPVLNKPLCKLTNSIRFNNENGLHKFIASVATVCLICGEVFRLGWKHTVKQILSTLHVYKPELEHPEQILRAYYL